MSQVTGVKITKPEVKGLGAVLAPQTAFPGTGAWFRRETPAVLGQTHPQSFLSNRNSIPGDGSSFPHLHSEVMTPPQDLAGWWQARVQPQPLPCASFIRHFSFAHRPEAPGSLQCGCGLGLGHTTPARRTFCAQLPSASRPQQQPDLVRGGGYGVEG